MKKWEIRPPLPQKPPNRSSPKFTWVTTSWTPTPMQNFIKIRLLPFAPQIRENSRRVTRLVFFGFFCQPTAKTPPPIFTIIVKKTLQFTMPFKDDIRHLAGLKQQIWQKMILLVQYIALMSLCCEVISSFVIFAVLDLRDGGCRP